MNNNMSATRNHGSKSQHGFSLIELMVVVVVIGILAAIAYPSYQESVRKTKRSEGKAALMRDMQQQERDYSRLNSYVAFSASELGNYRGFSGDNEASSEYRMSAAACGDGGLADCVEIRAVPVFTDEKCGTLTLRSNGVTGSSVDANAAECWK